MKFRKKEKRVNHVDSLLDQRKGITEQILIEIRKPEPNEAKIADLLERRDIITHDISIELEFMRNLDWIRDSVGCVGIGVLISGAAVLVRSKLTDN